MKKSSLALYSFAHFIVDFVCAYLMVRFAAAGTSHALLYNFCAFALQMPLGILADRFGRLPIFAASGCALVAASFAVFHIPLAMAMTAGLGNAFFHIGGGTDVLVHGVAGKKQRESLAPLGIFVSPGALGLFIGGFLAREPLLYSNIPAPLNTPFGAPLLLILCATGALIPILCRHRGKMQSREAPLSFNRWIMAAVTCMLLVVAARGFAGLTFAPEWKVGGLALLLVVMVVLGKCAGGFCADVVGVKRAVLFSLPLAGALLFAAQIPAAGLAGMFLFNMSMPVTLWVVSRLLPSSEGFSFGLLTFALFIGYLPAYFGITPPSGHAAISLFSALLMGVGFILGEKGLRNGAVD